MRDSFTQERKDIVGNINKGKNIPIETRERMRQAALNCVPMSEALKIELNV